MTEFGDWLEERVGAANKPPSPWEWVDLTNLTARLEGSLEKIRSGEIPEAVKREGLFACLTYKETIAALALAACKEFKEKYT